MFLDNTYHLQQFKMYSSLAKQLLHRRLFPGSQIETCRSRRKAKPIYRSVPSPEVENAAKARRNKALKPTKESITQKMEELLIKLLRINQIQQKDIYPRIWFDYLLADSRESMDRMISRIIDTIFGIDEEVSRTRQSISDHTGIKLTDLAQSIFDVEWTYEDKKFAVLRESINSLDDRKRFFSLVKATLEAAQELRGDIEKLVAAEKRGTVIRDDASGGESRTVFNGNLWEYIFGTDDQDWREEQMKGIDGLVRL